MAMRRFRCAPALWAAALLLSASDPAGADPDRSGREVYEFFCYQCHGYAGDGRTQAAAYLDPPPRRFTETDPGRLARADMIRAVTQGRNGTAMAAFSTVLSGREIGAVVDYVRTMFMSGARPDYRYHTVENGWPDHARYADAFPFVDGRADRHADERAVTPELRAGKRLFENACVTCHDVAPRGATAWELLGVSYPPGNYEHHDDESAAGPESDRAPSDVFELHERAPVLAGLSETEQAGGRLYRNHCAHCHAGDGTGRNWIGSFLVPHPPDFTDARVGRGMTRARAQGSIRHGIPHSAMPAWQAVLTDAEIRAVVAYLERAFGPFAPDAGSPAEAAPRAPLQWSRRSAP